MKQYKGIIFDLDGTLLDTIEDLTNSVNEVMLAMGYPIHTSNAYKKKVGKGFQNLIMESLPKEKREEVIIQEALQRFALIYEKNYMIQTKPYEGISEMLTELSKSGILIAVNSNKRDSYTKALIQKHFSSIPFVDVIGEREEFQRKPSPQAALFIVEKMKLPISEILYVGDSGTDMRTGANAGIDTIGVLWGFRDREELIENGAKYIVGMPEEILNFLVEGNSVRK